MTIKVINYNNIKILFKSWPTPTVGKMYAVASILVQFIFPFIIFMVVYIKIYNKFRQSTNNITSAQNVRQSHIQRRRRTNILLFLISLMYLVSWAPINIFTIIIKFTNITEVRHNILLGLSRITAHHSSQIKIRKTILCAEEVHHNSNFDLQF